MNISWLTLRDLQYLTAVADYRHFGKAAQACHVSQPALSAQVRKIEDVLKMQLFERSNRRVSVTPAGEAVVRQAKVVLEEAEKISALATIQPPLSGSLRLGAIATIGPYFIPYLLAPLRKQFPKLDLFLKEGMTDPLLDELRAGQLDAVIASDTFTEQALRVFPLFFEPFLLVVPTGHRLATKASLTARDLHADDMVLLEDGHCLRNQALDFCPASRRGHVRRFYATSLETLRHLVAVGSGYTLIPELAAQKDARLKSLLQYRRFDDKRIGRNVILATRARYGRLQDLETLAEFIRSHLPPGVMPIAPV
jgi:LysR family hydrogen peroxide-inducible transcriptional activator